MTTTDLIIIGAGPGGYRAAEYAAKQGLKVVIFEAGEVGGTCLNVGCIPTKTYVHSATFAEARERMAAVVPQLRAGVESILSHPNITLVKEACKFIDANCVNEFTAPHIIIATGSETKWLPIEGAQTDPRVVDSTGLLQLEQLPKRLVIIGAGVIGMEFASAFASFGSEVTVVEYLKECLPAMDSDIAKRLRKQLEKRGIKFFMGAGVKQVDGRVVSFERKGKTESVEADVILVATGRTPNVENLGLEKAGIAYDRLGIKVNADTFEVEKAEGQPATDTRIFAIGDVNGRQLLAHAATMQGRRVVNHILGHADTIRLDIMPAAVFTYPEAASVGPTEDQLKADGCAYTCHKGYYRSNGKALAMDETEGLVKLLTDADDRIIGCHILGAHAADLVQEVSALMCRDTTLQQLRDIVHIHPTLSEILQDIG